MEGRDQNMGWYASRWVHTLLLAILTFLTVLKENKVFRSAAVDWPALLKRPSLYGYYVLWVVLVVWFLVIIVAGGKLAVTRHEKAFRPKYAGWSLITLSAFAGMLVYIFMT